MKIFRKPKDAGDWFALCCILFGIIAFTIGSLIEILKGD